MVAFPIKVLLVEDRLAAKTAGQDQKGKEVLVKLFK